MKEFTKEELSLLDAGLECLMRAGVQREVGAKILTLSQKLQTVETESKDV